MNDAGLDVINLGIGSPDLPPSPEVMEVLYQSAQKAGNHGYQPYRGTPEIRLAISQWYQHVYGVILDTDRQILPLIGSKEGIFHISMAFLNPGDEVLIPNPGYPGYAGTTRLVGAIPVGYRLDPSNHWQPDWEYLNQLDTSKVKIMWMNYPHMPTGAVAQKATFKKLIKWCEERRILLCHDNPYSLILNPEYPLSLHSIPGALKVGLELNSLSKGHHMAGWRVGMLTGNSSYIDAVVQVKSNIDSGMFKGIQDAAVEALQTSSSWHHAQNGIYKHRKTLVQKLMDLLGCSYEQDTAGLFVWSKIPEGTDVIQFTDRILKEAKVFIVPGQVFGDQGKQYVRASLCISQERIKEAIERIRKIQIELA
ncbi:MAG: aminotransferase [Cyclobacteriaceae bacterium]|nr:MAG: aminotransferase [Cyclobacteriaceae bacterium]